MTYKPEANFYMIFGIVFFIIFAFDMEFDRDVFTWGWLLFSLLLLFASLVHWMKHYVSQVYKIVKESKEKIEKL